VLIVGGVKRVFRVLKTTALQVRPIFHRDNDMVRAHIFLCLLAAHTQWHMERDLKEILFADQDPVGQKASRKNPVVRTERSEKAERKAAEKETNDGHPGHSFRSLLENLASLGRVPIKAKIPGSAPFTGHAKAPPPGQSLRTSWPRAPSV